MKKITKIILLPLLVLTLVFTFLSCGAKTHNEVTEEQFKYAFSSEALENVTITTTFTFPDVRGEGVLKLEDDKSFLNVLLADETNYAMCSDSNYYYYYDGREWFQTSRTQYPDYVFGLVKEEQIHNFDLSEYFSFFEYNAKTDSYFANNVTFYLLEEYDFKSVEVKFDGARISKLVFTFSDSTKENPDTQTLLFQDYDATRISVLIEVN